jgi:hypothetical protein
MEMAEPKTPTLVTSTDAPVPMRPKRRPFVLISAIAAVLLGIIGAIWLFSAGSEATDDAQGRSCASR